MTPIWASLFASSLPTREATLQSQKVRERGYVFSLDRISEANSGSEEDAMANIASAAGALTSADNCLQLIITLKMCDEPDFAIDDLLVAQSREFLNGKQAVLK